MLKTSCANLEKQTRNKAEACKNNSGENLEPDECENDFRYIEEAESSGAVFVLKDVSDILLAFEKTQCDIGKQDKHEDVLKRPKTATIQNNIKENKGNFIDPERIQRLNSVPDVSSNTTNKKNKETVVTFNGNQSSCNSFSKAKHDAEKVFERPVTRNLGKISKDAILNEIDKTEFVSQSPEKTYDCQNCKRSFRRLSSLKAHFNICPNAGNLSRKFINAPTKQVKQGPDSLKTNCRQLVPRKCTDKNKSTTSKSTSTDKQTVFKTYVYKCTACQKISSNYSEHKKHTFLHNPDDKSLTKKISLKKLSSTPSGFFKCKKCDGCFMTAIEFRNHQMTHLTDFKCKICKGFLSSRIKLRKHINRHKKRPGVKKMKYLCLFCNKNFESLLAMLQHRKVHSEAIRKVEKMTIVDKSEGKSIYICKICAKTSKNRYRHEEHLRVHTKEKPYKCEKCGENMSTYKQLMQHLILHENERPFKCKKCKATYRHERSLKKHMKVHTGERPFKCHSCSMTFAFNYTRASHERKCCKSKKISNQKAGQNISESTIKTRSLKKSQTC